jgi:drug/metabolite transporter (DMT)-like permease
MWIIFTLLAIFFQTIRNLEQKKLSNKIDAVTASWSRFILPFPLAILTIIYFHKNINQQFAINIFLNAIFQSLGNYFLIKSLQQKNYSLAIAFAKTEVIQAIIVGLIFFNTKINFYEILSIIIAFVGVLMMINISINNKNVFLEKIKNTGNLYALLCGTCFAITAFNLKSASQILIDANFNYLISAILVLLFTIFLQNIFYGSIKIYQKRLICDLKKLFLAENLLSFLIAGITSFFGSIFWYTAYAIGQVIYVKTLGQLEVIIAILISAFFLKEQHKKIELIGILVTLFGILFLLLHNFILHD